MTIGVAEMLVSAHFLYFLFHRGVPDNKRISPYFDF